MQARGNGVSQCTDARRHGGREGAGRVHKKVLLPPSSLTLRMHAVVHPLRCGAVCRGNGQWGTALRQRRKREENSARLPHATTRFGGRAEWAPHEVGDRADSLRFYYFVNERVWHPAHLPTCVRGRESVVGSATHYPDTHTHVGARMEGGPLTPQGVPHRPPFHPHDHIR